MNQTFKNARLAQWLTQRAVEQHNANLSNINPDNCVPYEGDGEEYRDHAEYVHAIPQEFQNLPELQGKAIIWVQIQSQDLQTCTHDEMHENELPYPAQDLPF